MRHPIFLASLTAVTLVAAPSLAKTIHVTPADSYQAIEAAQAGDEVLIAPGTYQFRVSLENSGTESSKIVLRAEDPANPPVWDLDGQAIGDWPGSYTAGDKGRGCWQVRGDHYVIESIIFDHCRDSAGAGLRFVNVQDAAVRGCVFRNSVNGVTGAAEGLVIEYSEFYNNGVVYTPGDNASHNLYVFGGTLALRYNYFHDSNDGQLFHVRARDSVIEYNWFSHTGNYPGDLMSCEYFCGGTGTNPITQKMLLRGNVIVQDAAQNHGQIIALYKDGGASSDDSGEVSRMELTMSYNTIIGTPVNPGQTQRLVNMRNDSVDTHVVLDNNVVYQVHDLAIAEEPATANWSVQGTSNWLSTGTDPGTTTGSIIGDDPGFESVANRDYRPAAGSPLRGKAAASSAGAPVAEYYQGESNPLQYRDRATANDIGAFEYGTSGPPHGMSGAAGSAGTGSGGTSGAGGTGSAGAGGAGGSGTSGSGGASSGGAGQGGSGGYGPDGSAPDSGQPAAPGTGSEEDSGCGCRTAPAGSQAWWIAGLLGVAWGMRLRRRATSSGEPGR